MLAAGDEEAAAGLHAAESRSAARAPGDASRLVPLLLVASARSTDAAAGGAPRRALASRSTESLRIMTRVPSEGAGDDVAVLRAVLLTTAAYLWHTRQAADQAPGP